MERFVYLNLWNGDEGRNSAWLKIKLDQWKQRESYTNHWFEITRGLLFSSIKITRKRERCAVHAPLQPVEIQLSYRICNSTIQLPVARKLPVEIAPPELMEYDQIPWYRKGMVVTDTDRRWKKEKKENNRIHKFLRRIGSQFHRTVLAASPLFMQMRPEFPF